MSSVLVEYPEGLPAPTTGEVRPTERRAISSVGQMRNTRAIQRDRHGTRTVAFTFTPDQAAIFREWWVEWLQLGGGWFAANWPLPWSRGPNVFRFTDPPQWQLIGGRLDGQGYWQVRATCEIRGRGMLPTAEVMYLTSTPYPMEVFENAIMHDVAYAFGKLQTAITESADAAEISGISYSNGVLKSTYISYEQVDYSEISDVSYTNGVLKSTRTEIKVEEYSLISDVNYNAGELKQSLIVYKNWKSEGAQLSDVSYSNGNLS